MEHLVTDFEDLIKQLQALSSRPYLLRAAEDLMVETFDEFNKLVDRCEAVESQVQHLKLEALDTVTYDTHKALRDKCQALEQELSERLSVSESQKLKADSESAAAHLQKSKDEVKQLKAQLKAETKELPNLQRNNKKLNARVKKLEDSNKTLNQTLAANKKARQQLSANHKRLSDAVTEGGLLELWEDKKTGEKLYQWPERIFVQTDVPDEQPHKSSPTLIYMGKSGVGSLITMSTSGKLLIAQATKVIPQQESEKVMQDYMEAYINADLEQKQLSN